MATANTAMNKTKIFCMIFGGVTQYVGGVLGEVYVYWRITALSSNATGKVQNKLQSIFRMKKDSKTVFYERDLKNKNATGRGSARPDGS